MLALSFFPPYEYTIIQILIILHTEDVDPSSQVLLNKTMDNSDDITMGKSRTCPKGSQVGRQADPLMF